jgi:plastocyanin
LSAFPVAAESLQVTVVDVDGQPVADVVVYISPGDLDSPSARRTAIMDQRDTRFLPHILVVQKGTSVEFPNSDVVAHHVYSFSKPNNFVLPLYKGDPHNPVVFEHDGIVTLGCNIHDDMLAYIVVVETDMFGVTDEDGKLVIDVNDPGTELAVNIWSPRIRDKELSQLVAGDTSSVTFSLQKKLRPPHDPGNEGVQWSEY